MKSQRNNAVSLRDEIHRSNVLAKRVHRELDNLITIIFEIRDDLKQMHATLDASNRNSATFWTKFKRDFPEVELDERAYHNIVCVSKPRCEHRVERIEA